ncbi:MAG TPA: hypothetical protein VLV86_01815 [Vicinamibacterales bacterium]|nr:hypothetical protein [Vicinamibacterales bacterium]
MRLSSCTVLAIGAFVFGAATLAAPRADAADACSMLTAAQAAAAMGVPEAKASPGANRCIWTPTKYKRGAGSTVTLQLMDAKGFDAYRALPHSDVAGVGDAALQNPRLPEVLLVKKGNVYFSLSVHGLPADQAGATVQSLAKQVMP